MDQISCVIPTLNSASTLDMTLYSLRSQKNVEVNIIVVDSGSTDSTLDICKRWKVKNLYAEPGNMYQAINTGLSQCNTEWLAYVNSDDWLYPDSLVRLIAHGKTSMADVVYGTCDYTDEAGRFVYSFAALKPHQLLSLFRIGIFGFAQQSAIFRHRVYHQLQGFNENYKFSADAEFYLRSLQAGFKFDFMPGSSVSCFRLHGNQLSNKKSKAMESERKIIFAGAGKVKIIDWLVFAQWRLKNIPHYLIRLLRQSLLSGKLKITNSMDAYSYQD